MSEMEQTSQPANSDSESIAKKKAPHNGNYLGVSALVLAVLAGIVVVVLWSDMREMRREAEGANQQLRSSVTALDEWAQQQREQRFAPRLQGVEQEMTTLREELARERIDWLVAESDYLLRLASRRLQLERDVRGALIALRAADALLAEGGNPLYLPVREKLREEILALEAVPKVDVDGISLEVSTLSRQVEQMPLATARHAVSQYQAEAQETSDADASWFSRLLHGIWNDVKSLVTVRRLDQKIQPLLLPEQRYFLIQNMRLRLEQARLALQRGDNALYQENMQVAAQWLDEYFDSDDSAVRNGIDALTRLAKLDIAPPLPEMGASLSALDKIRLRSGNGQGKKS